MDIKNTHLNNFIFFSLSILIVVILSKFIGFIISLFIGIFTFIFFIFLLPFIKYLYSSPKELLNFHSIDDFEKFPLNELKNLRRRLGEGGLLKEVNDVRKFCTVDKQKWRELNQIEKITFGKLCSVTCNKMHNLYSDEPFLIQEHQDNIKSLSNRKDIGVYIPDGGLFLLEGFYKDYQSYLFDDMDDR